jgi:glycosyltransferase involved in cell wall biosynthesis
VTRARVRVTWASFDGADTEYTGVGTLTTYLLHEWAKVRRSLAAAGVDASLRLIGVASTAGAHMRRSSHRLLRQADCVSLLLTNPVMSSPYGRPDAWGHLSQALVNLVKTGRQPGTREIVLLHDVHFLAAAASLHELDGLSVLPVLHSVALNWHDRGNAGEQQANGGREAYERTHLAVLSSRGVRLLAVSETLADQVYSAYGVARPQVVNFGISLDYVRRLARSSALARYSNDLIPVGSGEQFAIWFGRATYDKGYDYALRALSQLADACKFAPLVFLSDYGVDEDLRRAVEMTRKEPRVRVLINYPFALPRHLLAHSRLGAVLVTPRVEPFGLIPSEFFVGAAAGKGSPLIGYCPVDGLREQLALTRYGHVVSTDGLTVDTSAVVTAALTSETERRNAVIQGAALVAQDMDMAATLTRLLKQCLR